MNPKDQVDFLKRPRLDIGGRHKKKRIEIAGRWATANDQDAVEPLTTVVRDRQDDPDVRLAAVQSLGAVGAGQAVSTLAAILSDRTESGLHLAAITALGSIGDDQAVQALIGAWEQVKASQQNTIRQAMVQLGPERTVEPLIEILGHSSPTVREQAATTLRQFEGIAPRLVAALGHEDADVRDGIESLLVQMGSLVVPDLVATLEHVNDRARDRAVEVLIGIGKPAVDALISALATDDEQVITAATGALLGIGEPAVQPLLVAMEGNAKVTDVLRQMGESAIKPLVVALKHEPTRASATTLLIEIGKPATEQLYAALDTDDEMTRPTVVDILTHITGQTVEELVETAYGNFMFLHLDLISAQAQGEEWRQALPLLHRAVKLDPEYAQGHYWLAKVYVELDQSEAAAKHYERAISGTHRADMPDDFTTKSRQRLIEYYSERKEYADALGHAEILLETAPDDVELHQRLAMLYRFTDQYEKTIAHLEKAIVLGTDETALSAPIAEAAHKGYLHVVGQIEFDEHTRSRVLPLFEKMLFYGEMALRNKPDDEMLRFVPAMRQFYDELDDIDQHKQAFVYRLRGEYALQNAAALAALAEQLSEMAEIGVKVLEEDAIPAFQEAIRLKPDYAAARHRLSDAYERLGRYQEAANMLEEGIRLSPDYWLLYFTLGDIQLKQFDQPYDAIQTYRKGLEINPSWAAGYGVLGAAYFVTEQYTRAQYRPDTE